MTDFKEIAAGGGVVYRRRDREPEVLMIHRRGVWDLPKGKIEPDETVEEGALREVGEETGCGELRIRFPLGTTEHGYLENGSEVRKKTWWYAMESGRPDLKPQESEQIDALEWMKLNAATELAHYDNLRTVLGKFKENINSAGT